MNQDAQHLTDRELLLSVHQTVQMMDQKLREQNGRLGKVEQTQQLQAVKMGEVAGAIGFGRWLLIAMMGIMSAGAGLAGVVLAFVSRM